jgi:hypothetical protein
LGRKTLLSVVIEDELVKYLMVMENKLYGFIRKDARALAYHLAVRN